MTDETNAEPEAEPLASYTKTIYCAGPLWHAGVGSGCLVSKQGFEVEVEVLKMPKQYTVETLVGPGKTERQQVQTGVISPMYRFRYVDDRPDAWFEDSPTEQQPFVCVDDEIQAWIVEQYRTFVLEGTDTHQSWPKASQALRKLLSDNFEVVKYTSWQLEPSATKHRETKAKLLELTKQFMHHSGPYGIAEKPLYAELRNMGYEVLPSIYQLLEAGHHDMILRQLLHDVTGRDDIGLPEACRGKVRVITQYWLHHLYSRRTKYWLIDLPENIVATANAEWAAEQAKSTG